MRQIKKPEIPKLFKDDYEVASLVEESRATVIFQGKDSLDTSLASLYNGQPILEEQKDKTFKQYISLNGKLFHAIVTENSEIVFEEK